MKKFYFSAIFIIWALSVVFIGYGAYLNSTSDSYIRMMLASRIVSLSGVRASYRDIAPELYLEYVSMRASNQADVITEIDGQIEVLHVSQGQEVKRRQPLCKLVNKEVSLAISKANTEIARVEASYVQALKTVERNKKLVAKNFIARNELETSVSQMEVLKAELNAAKIAKKQLEQQMGYQTVTSPLSGTIVMLYQQSGNSVVKGTPIAMVADFSKMNFTVTVNDKDIKNIAPIEGQFALHAERKRHSTMLTALSNIPVMSSFSDNMAFDVKISSILPPLNESAPTRSMTCEVDNRLGVLEFGMYTDVMIRKNAAKNVLAIPRAAVSEQGGARVYVRDADSRLAVREIRTGVYDSEYVEVADGLEDGDIVITSGVSGLALGVEIEVNTEE